MKRQHELAELPRDVQLAAYRRMLEVQRERRAVVEANIGDIVQTINRLKREEAEHAGHRPG